MDITQLYIYWAILFFVTGTMVGSFFNVLIYRLPNGKSVITPPSACPKCKHEITWYENIPIISYIFLGAKCSSCKTHISIQYPLVEFITGIYSLALYHLYFRELISPEMNYVEVSTVTIQYITLLLAIPITMIDIKYFIIPDSLSLGGLGFAVILAFLPGGITPQFGGLGILAGGGILLLFGYFGSLILKKEAMGGGDIKMLAWFGALFGPFIALGTIFLGALVGTVISLIILPFGKKDFKSVIPFAPSLYLGLIIAVVYGEKIWYWYEKVILKVN